MQILSSYTLHDFPELGSTNVYAIEHIKESIDRSVYLTRKQTAGKGRQGNTWEDGAGNLFVSIVLKPQHMSAEQAGQMSFVTSVAVRKTIQSFLPDTVPVKLKWPNDILINHQKVNGILLESSFDADQNTEWLVVGIGVNLVSKPSLETAGCLLDFNDTPITVEMFLPRLIENFDRVYNQFLAEGFGLIREEWLSHALSLGETIQVRLPHETFQVTFIDIDDKGQLIGQKDDLSRVEIASGDIFFE